MKSYKFHWANEILYSSVIGDDISPDDDVCKWYKMKLNVLTRECIMMTQQQVKYFCGLMIYKNNVPSCNLT